MVAENVWLLGAKKPRIPMMPMITRSPPPMTRTKNQRRSDGSTSASSTGRGTAGTAVSIRAADRRLRCGSAWCQMIPAPSATRVTSPIRALSRFNHRTWDCRISTPRASTSRATRCRALVLRGVAAAPSSTGFTGRKAQNAM
jgi:hypothetical protein